MPQSIRLSVIASAIVLSLGCYLSPLRLAPGEAASMDFKLQPGTAQMVEMEASGVDDRGAEVTLVAGDVRLPPVYFGMFGARNSGRSISAASSSAAHQSVFSSFGGFQEGGQDLFTAQMWSPLWPVSPESEIKVQNFGPSPVTFKRVRIRKGEQGRVLGRAEREAPFPPLGRVDVMEILGKAPVEGILDERAIAQLPSVRSWLAQRRRRAAFEQVAGLPLAARLGDRVLGDLQIRAHQLGGATAIVSISRPSVSSWQALGPGWLPRNEEAKWQPLPAGEHPLPRSFRIVGALHSLAVFLAATVDGAESKSGSIVQGKLFSLDSTQPISTVEWQGIGPEGKWVDISFPNGPLPPGDYVLELRALKGSPSWLVWSRVREPIPGTDLTKSVETLLVQQSPAAVKHDEKIAASVRVPGQAVTVEHFQGPDDVPKKEAPRIADQEMIFEASLLPGETEIFLLNGYQAQ